VLLLTYTQSRTGRVLGGTPPAPFHCDVYSLMFWAMSTSNGSGDFDPDPVPATSLTSHWPELFAWAVATIAPMDLFGPDSASAKCSCSAIACSASVPSAQARRCAAAMNMQRDLDEGVGLCGLVWAPVGVHAALSWRRRWEGDAGDRGPIPGCAEGRMSRKRCRLLMTHQPAFYYHEANHRQPAKTYMHTTLTWYR